MPRVHGILETALYVSDVKRAADFYQRLFGFNSLLESDRLIALNVADRDVLLLFQQGATKQPLETAGGVIPGHSGTGSNHLAFAITRDEVSEWLQKLESEKITLESTVTWTGGSQSFYFRDLDDNLVELTTPGLWSIY